MDFEKMKEECPWQGDPGAEDTNCIAAKGVYLTCLENNCVPFHWVSELRRVLYVSVHADLLTD